MSNLHETEVGDQFTSLEALIGVLAGPDCGLARVRGSRVRSGELLGWLETQAGLDSVQRARIQALFKRLSTNPSLLLFALRYTLTPDAPLELCPDVAARSPAELAATLLGAWPDIESPLNALGILAASGRLPEWLRASEASGWEEVVQKIELARTRHPGDLDLPGWLLLWAYGAKSPFPFNGCVVETPQDLARAIDALRGGREDALRLLDAGWIRAWLIATGRLADPADWDAAAQDTKIAPSVRLAAALLRLDPDRPAPVLRAAPAKLDFGSIRRGEQRQLDLRFDTLQGESFACSLSIQDAGVPIALNVTHLEAIPATIQVSAGDRGLAAGHRVETAILVNGGGAELRVPVRFRVAASDAAAQATLDMPGAGNRPNTGKKTKAIGIAAIIGLILILIATAIFVYDKTHQDLDIKIDVPVFVAQSAAEDAAVASANRHVRSLIDARIADFRRDHAKAVAEGVTGPAWSLEIEHGPLQRGAHFLAVLIGGYEFSGGAHGMNIIEPLVFALADGRRIQPEDLFRPNSAWLNRLARHCYAELKLRDFGLRDEAWVRAGTEPVAKNYRLLLPGPDGLRVIFEPYAVASYSDGTQEVLIAYRDLADILAPALF